MKKSERANRTRQMLDKRLAQLPPASEFAVPRAGWIRAIRDALGMSAAQLGQRIGVTGATVSETEAKEREGGVRLSTLRRAAEAMDCTLVYAFIPNDNLESTVREQAKRILDRQTQRVHQNMVLEDQASELLPAAREARLQSIIDSGRLWSGNRAEW